MADVGMPTWEGSSEGATWMTIQLLPHDMPLSLGEHLPFDRTTLRRPSTGSDPVSFTHRTRPRCRAVSSTTTADNERREDERWCKPDCSGDRPRAIVRQLDPARGCVRPIVERGALHDRTKC